MNHAIAVELARMIRDRMLYDDGSIRPCGGTTLNPLWVSAVSNNLAMAIVGTYDVRPNAMAGEISDEPPPVRTPVDAETMSEHAARVIK